MAIREIKRKEIDNLMNDDKIKYKKPIKNQYIVQDYNFSELSYESSKQSTIQNMMNT